MLIRLVYLLMNQVWNREQLLFIMEAYISVLKDIQVLITPAILMLRDGNQLSGKSISMRPVMQYHLLRRCGVLQPMMEVIRRIFTTGVTLEYPTVYSMILMDRRVA